MNITKADIGKSVRLRDGREEKIVDISEGVFCVEGEANRWKDDGKWHHDDRHNLDIVKILSVSDSEQPTLTLDDPLETLHRYQPKDEIRGTRISWIEGDACLEFYAKESESYFYTGIEELPQLIAALTAIYDKTKKELDYGLVDNGK